MTDVPKRELEIKIARFYVGYVQLMSDILKYQLYKQDGQLLTIARQFIAATQSTQYAAIALDQFVKELEPPSEDQDAQEHTYSRSKDLRRGLRPALILANAYLHGEAVATCVIYHTELHLYVKPVHRRVGIASALWDSLYQRFPLFSTVFSGERTIEAQAFAKKIDLPSCQSQLAYRFIRSARWNADHSLFERHIYVT